MLYPLQQYVASGEFLKYIKAERKRRLFRSQEKSHSGLDPASIFTQFSPIQLLITASVPHDFCA